MEAFTLLKYWRGGAGLVKKNDSTIVTDKLHQTIDDDVDNDEGPFFDLDLQEGEEEDERMDQSLVLSPPSDGGGADEDGKNLFFKGKLVTIEDLETNPKPQFPNSLLKSATKFRVFMLGFKKSKPNLESNSTKKENSISNNNKLFTVKFKVEEVKPIASIFTRNNSKLSLKHSILSSTTTTTELVDDKRFSKEIMQKYLKKVKPLYIRVSKRYGDKVKSAAAASPKTAAVDKSTEGEETTAKAAAAAGVKQEGGFPAGLRVVCKHLGKSKSASAVAAATSPPSRRDDSLLQQEDGIQSAILHCKRSFNASRDSDASLLLSRSVSDPSYEKSFDLNLK
ncbi:hypothetical protein ACFE04_014297 [Oxalis oulophora]